MFSSRLSTSEVREKAADISFPLETRMVSHQNGFLILKSATIPEALADGSNAVLFHGNEFSFEPPGKKHQKEYRKNVLNIHDFFCKVGLTLLESGTYSPLRRHSDTVFLPINLGGDFPFYIYPWISDKASLSTTDFPKIKQFVMANCLFGSSILGVDDQGNKYPLIDHNLEVQDIITNIEANDHVHPYEDMSFSALQGLLPLMRTMGDDSFSIRYHLPILDYMLYGVHLYISGKITFDAFENFIEQVEKRGRKHKEIIFNIAEKSGVTIYVESPFDNLFSSDIKLTASKLLEQLSLSTVQVDRMKQEHPKFSRALSRTAKRSGHRVEDFKSIIEILNTIDEFFADPSQAISESTADSTLKSPRILFEELCIENILDHLTNNDKYLEYQQVWRAIIAGGEINRFSPLQQLFKVANVAFVARARVGHDNFEVCSLLPIDEKPIAQTYKDLLSSRFGHILCLSWFPPLLNYISHEENPHFKHHQHNLFRLRTDLFTVNQERIRAYLSDYFKLPLYFWSIVDESFYDHEIQKTTKAFISVAPVEAKLSNYSKDAPHILWNPIDQKKLSITRSVSAPASSSVKCEK